MTKQMAGCLRREYIHVFTILEYMKTLVFPVTKCRNPREYDVTLVKEQGNLQNGKVFSTEDYERMERSIY